MDINSAKVLNWLNNNVDKVAHESLCNLISWVAFIFSFLLLAGINLLVKAPIWIIYTLAILFAIVVAFLIGWKKEIRDPIFDKKDILANCIGILRFSAQLLIIYLIFKHF